MTILRSWPRGSLATADTDSGGVPLDSVMPGDDPLEGGVIITPTGGILWGQRDTSEVEQALYLPDVAADKVVSLAPDTGLLFGAGLLIVGVVCVALLFR